MNLLTRPNGNVKIAKGMPFGIRTYILHLSPARSGGRDTVCPDATPACIAACLNLSGQALMSPGRILGGRRRKTRLFFDERKRFLEVLKHEIKRAIEREWTQGYMASFRLNGTSDIPWEQYNIPQAFPGSQFYDYTKSIKRYRKWLSGNLPDNYYLTYSQSEKPYSRRVAREFVLDGGNAAIVFARKDLTTKYRGLPLISGDETDYRPDDPPGCFIGLRFKGLVKKREKAIKDGFAN